MIKGRKAVTFRWRGACDVDFAKGDDIGPVVLIEIARTGIATWVVSFLRNIVSFYAGYWFDELTIAIFV